MTEFKEIGVIQSAKFGWSGYQDVQIGLSVTLKMKGSGVVSFDGFWGLERSDHCKWTEEERQRYLGETVMRLAKILTDAKKNHVEELVGVPVEVTLDGNLLKSWRVLTEVIL